MSFNPHISKMEWLNTCHEEPQYIIFTTRHISCQQPVCTFTPYAHFKVDRLTTPPISKNSPASRLLRSGACYSIFKVMLVTNYCAYLSAALNVSYLGNKFFDRISCILDVFRFYTLRNVHCDIDVKCSIFWNSDFSLPLYVIWTEGRKMLCPLL